MRRRRAAGPAAGCRAREQQRGGACQGRLGELYHPAALEPYSGAYPLLCVIRTVRLKRIGNEMIQSVGKSGSCMVSQLPTMIFKRTRKSVVFDIRTTFERTAICKPFDWKFAYIRSCRLFAYDSSRFLGPI